MGKNKKKKNKNNESTEKKVDKKLEKVQNNKEEKLEKVELNKIVKKQVHRHTSSCKIGKKIKNLISLSILLFGFAAGSLFVDVAQLYNKEGFSALALKSANIINYNGSTWVRYDAPKVIVDVVVSDECKEECEVIDDLLSNLQSEIPTLEAHRINISKPEYKTYVNNNNITSLPAFVFDNSLEGMDFYKEGELILDKKENGKIHIKMNELQIQTMKLEVESNSSKDESLSNSKEDEKEAIENTSSAVSI